MNKVELISYPNQQFSIDVDNNRYDLSIKDCDGFMVIDIVCNNQIIVKGQRLLPGIPLIPYLYREQGNFLLVTEKEELADWQKFNISQFLYFIANSELAEIRSD
ncbi:hypothetical protein DKL61_02270 [Gammaproteobacteria bacterium ESL0073]|nr:hypothetical protein DKL61_02270 [Gammaproteobacteria bacterium ESL0073]